MNHEALGIAATDLALIAMHCRVQSFHLDVSQALGAYSTRTYAPAPFNSARAIHRLDSANSVVSCAVFFFSPR